MSRSHSWLHIQDFELDAAFKLGMIKRIPFIEKLARDWELRVYRRFNTVSAISRAMLNRLTEKRVEEHRKIYFPNWIDTSLIFPLEGENRYRRALQFAPADIVVLYSGSIGQKQGIESLIDSVKRLSMHRYIHLVICGEGSGKSQLQKDADGCANIHFLPVQPAEFLNELLNLADLHVLPQKAGAADLVMPSKLLGMLSSGRPVIATCQKGSELYEVVSEVGLTCSPGNPAELAKKILDLASNKKLRKELGARGREYVINHYSADIILKKINAAFLDRSC